MLKENCTYSNEWDYLGHVGVFPNMSGFDDDNQKDWNQTLVTKINQCSANIFHTSQYGGGSYIKINSKLFPLFKSLKFYDDELKSLSGRFTIEIDDSIEDNIIFVCHRLLKNEVLFVPEFISPTYGDQFWKWTFVEARLVPEEKVNEYKKGLCAYVIIKNYEN